MDKKQEKHYEELFNQLLERGRGLHTSNKRRIRIGMIFLLVFTITMILIRWSTGSDRATFLIVWVIGMFAICIYLVGIEYIDNSLEKTLEEVTDREADWDNLIPDSESMRGIVQDRIEDRREERRDRINERRTELQDRYQTFWGNLENSINMAKADGQTEQSEADEQAQIEADIADAVETAGQTEPPKESAENIEQKVQPESEKKGNAEVTVSESGDEA